MTQRADKTLHPSPCTDYFRANTSGAESRVLRVPETRQLEIPTRPRGRAPPRAKPRGPLHRGWPLRPEPVPWLWGPQLQVQGLRVAGLTPVVMTQSTSLVWCSWRKKSGLDASSFLS